MTMEQIEILNIDFGKDGTVRRRKGWKTLKGMFYQIKLMNNKYKKLGVKGKFTIELPLP